MSHDDVRDFARNLIAAECYIGEPYKEGDPAYDILSPRSQEEVHSLVERLMREVIQYGDQRELAGRIEELNKLDLNNNPGSCREDCSEMEHARHEGQYGHYLHIESYKNGRIAELEAKEVKSE